MGVVSESEGGKGNGDKINKYQAWTNHAFWLAGVMTMSEAQDSRNEWGRTYNICDRNNEHVQIGQHSREDAQNYYSIRDLDNRLVAPRSGLNDRMRHSF